VECAALTATLSLVQQYIQSDLSKQRDNDEHIKVLQPTLGRPIPAMEELIKLVKKINGKGGWAGLLDKGGKLGYFWNENTMKYLLQSVRGQS
jgi:hypothetical protein